MNPPQHKDLMEFLSKITLVSDEECRKATVRLCASRRITEENLEGKCDACNKPIFYDPGFPMGPLCRFLCLDCAMELPDLPQSLSE